MGEYDPFDRSDLKNQPERDQHQPAKPTPESERHGPDDNEKVGHGREPKHGANGGLSHGSQPKL